MIVNAPFFVEIGKRKKKKFYFNLNTYRNAYFHQLDAAKKLFKDLVSEQIDQLPLVDNILLVYTTYPRTLRKFDVANVCSVVDKFFSDALVSGGKLPDDNYEHLPYVLYRFGHVDRENPRVEIKIVELTDDLRAIIENEFMENEPMKVSMNIILSEDELKQAASQYVAQSYPLQDNQEHEVVFLNNSGQVEATVVAVDVVPADSKPSNKVESKPKVVTPPKKEEAPVEVTEPVQNISSGEENREEPQAPSEQPKVSLFSAPAETEAAPVEVDEPQEEEAPTEVEVETPEPETKEEETVTAAPKATTSIFNFSNKT